MWKQIVLGVLGLPFLGAGYVAMQPSDYEGNADQRDRCGAGGGPWVDQRFPPVG